MKPTRRNALLALVLSGVALAAGGCSTSPRSRFYVLNPLAPPGPTEATPGGPQVTFGIAPIGLPKYLGRPQIVTRGTRNQLIYGEFDRWAEPLEDNLASVLGENLTRRLGDRGLIFLPFRQAVQGEYQVWVQMTRFEVDTDGTASLHAMWTIRNANNRKELPVRRSQLEESSEGNEDEYGFHVEALSRTVNSLSEEIASAIREELASSPVKTDSN